MALGMKADIAKAPRAEADIAKAPRAEAKRANAASSGTTVPFGRLTAHSQEATLQLPEGSAATVVYNQRGTIAGQKAYENFDWDNFERDGYILS